MDLLADIDPVNAVLVVHLRHGYGVDTTHHNTHQGQQDLCNGIAEDTRSHQIGMDLSGNISVDGNAAIRVFHLPYAVQTQSYG